LVILYLLDCIFSQPCDKKLWNAWLISRLARLQKICIFISEIVGNGFEYRIAIYYTVKIGLYVLS